MIAPNTLLQNRYLVEKQIGQGGMGAVYVATDQRFGSTVALKETFFDDANMRKAFEREARLLNHLRHPALPRVSDHFNEDDGQFIVMEFIPGDDLSVMLKEQGTPFPLSKVLDWADQLLDALEYLHTHEPPIVHRDIKPQNLKLTSRGHIVLLDFGLAKGTPLQASRVTATGSVFGYSFNYAPLEQMQGTGTDPRSDLYSLGATLYHLMTGLTPPDALTRATAVLNGDADPLRPANEIQAQATQPVARVLMEAMAQSAAKRPPTAASMREALRAAGKQSSLAGAPTVLQPTSNAALHEQDTQIIGARTGTPISEAATNVKTAGTPSVLNEAATVIQPNASASNPTPSTAHNRDDESIVTEVRAKRTQPSKQWMSGRVIGVALGVLLLSVAAAALYNFTQKPPAQPPSVQTVVPPPPVDPATPAQTAPAAVVEQNPAPSPVPSPAPTQQAGNVPKKIIIRKHTATAGNPQVDMGDEDVPDEPPDKPDKPNKFKNSGLSPEERAQITEEVRRARQQAWDAERQKRDALRQQQFERQRELRRRNRTPTPYYNSPN